MPILPSALCAAAVPADAPARPLVQTECERAYARAVVPEAFLHPGERLDVDAGPAVRRALASGKPVRFTRSYVVRPDPASVRDVPANAYWSIRVPSNAVLFFEPSSRIVQAPGAAAWTRTVSFQGATRFNVFGTLAVDANGGRIDPRHNEHMHGVFFYDSTDFYVAAIDSRNARGDNVFIGGDDDTVGSTRGYIGRITAAGAGRKNLVLQAFDRIRIGHIDLDNRGGGGRLYSGPAVRGRVVQPSASVYATDTGAAMLNTRGPQPVLGTTQAELEARGFRVDDTDGHTLDIEPDVFTGRILSRVTIDDALLRGSGWDSSATIERPASERLIADFRALHIDVAPRRGVPPWLQYGVSNRVRRLVVDGLSADLAQSQILYGARLEVEHATLNGHGTSPEFAILLSRVGGNTPVARIGRLDGSLGGGGIEVRNSSLYVGEWGLRTAGPALWARGVAADPSYVADVKIGRFDATGSGGSGGCNCVVRASQEGRALARLAIEALRSASRPATGTIVESRGGARLAIMGRDTPLAPQPVTVEP